MMVADYDKQVYTALLGKVLGVFVGKPIEAWSRARIEERFGVIDRYVHGTDPIVVPDDDIAGPLVFIRALEDSGLYADTPDDFFGKTWLNYLMENQTVLWWGGLGVSTEHTAFLRLKHGVPSPRSGSIELNGHAVAEQIGGQIFIDGWGMVAPGNPRLAAQLAKKAAGVSHDGEAVYAGQVVAAMIAEAFVNKDIERVLDVGVSVIPADCAIAQIHRDVRAWVKADGDWRKTYDRIDSKYGYRHYSGFCHVVPNHALMVMAWSYGQGDYFKTLSIVNSCGWDTDCNSGNCATVTALIAGLEHLCDEYDFRTPVSDRVFVPSADGTYCASDILTHALRIAAMGRRVMGYPAPVQPKNGAQYHFEMPGATQGFRVDDAISGGGVLTNEPAPEGFAGKHALALKFRSRCRIATPVYWSNTENGYSFVGTSSLYNGMTLHLEGIAGEVAPGSTLKFMVIAFRQAGGEPHHYFSPAIPLVSGERIVLDWTLEGIPGNDVIFSFGVEADGGPGKVLVDSIRLGGRVNIAFPAQDAIHFVAPNNPCGWISNLDGKCGMSVDGEFPLHIVKNEGVGVLVNGNRHWKDVIFHTGFTVHAADQAGILLRYQGLKRYYAVFFGRKSTSIVREYYGREVLAQCDFVLTPDHLYDVAAAVCGNRISLSVNGKELLCAVDDLLSDGGAGFGVENGFMGFHAPEITATL